MPGASHLIHVLYVYAESGEQPWEPYGVTDEHLEDANPNVRATIEQEARDVYGQASELRWVCINVCPVSLDGVLNPSSALNGKVEADA